jgi:protein-L-isoaspartate(D-aspartate) O-methyltransferase
MEMNEKNQYAIALLLCALCLSLLRCTSPPTPTPLPAQQAQDPYQQPRESMVYQQIEQRGVSDPAVLEAMRTVPRHAFVPQEWLESAYEDHPLPIGYGQTISQPFIVAWMTELLQLDPTDRVLEIGTGSGYQAAILGELGCEVYTVEIIEALADQAKERLAEMGYSRITVAHQDGYYGWPEHAPYDAIIVTCAPDHIPPPLIEQLDTGGRMVVPVGPPGGYQSLFLITKENGKVKSQNLGAVSFVPLTR